jgi:hypothetical protein
LFFDPTRNPVGSSTLTVTATSGTLTQTANTTLNVTTSAPSLKPISINFIGTDVAMASTEVAGVVAVANCKLASGAASSAPLALVDDTGAATTATISWTAGDIWQESITDAPGKARMMKDNLGNGIEDPSVINVSGIVYTSNR